MRSAAGAGQRDVDGISRRMGRDDVLPQLELGHKGVQFSMHHRSARIDAADHPVRSAMARQQIKEGIILEGSGDLRGDRDGFVGEVFLLVVVA